MAVVRCFGPGTGTRRAVIPREGVGCTYCSWQRERTRTSNVDELCPWDLDKDRDWVYSK